MPPAGAETLALWREVGQWWADEPQLEVHRFIDGKGVRRQEMRKLSALNPVHNNVQGAYQEDFKEEICLRVERARDDKVARACGLLPNPDFSGFIIDPTQQRYSALHTYSGYAFGKSTFMAAELAAVAGQRGYKAVLIADPFSLTGAVEFWKTANTCGVHPLIGTSFEMADGGTLVLVARNKEGWKNLSRLITACHLEEPRLFPLCTWERLERYAEGLLCLTGGDCGPVNRLLIKKENAQAKALLKRLAALYGRENVFVEIERTYQPWEITVNKLLLELASEMRLTPVAGSQITHS
jgi:error-prone DNA polymerase